jgi:hypothetical protein
MPGNMSMKTKKKSACIDFRTNLETSLNGHIQLVDSNERLISFNYRFSRGEFPIFHHNFWLNSRTRLDFMPGNSSMYHITNTRMGGEPTADESTSLFEFMNAADKCLYFFANGLECAIILKGHPSKKEKI